LWPKTQAPAPEGRRLGRGLVCETGVAGQRRSRVAAENKTQPEAIEIANFAAEQKSVSCGCQLRIVDGFCMEVTHVAEERDHLEGRKNWLWRTRSETDAFLPSGGPSLDQNPEYPIAAVIAVACDRQAPRWCIILSRCRVGRTRKDLPITNRVLEVVKRDDGTFDLFLNQKLDRNRIPEKWLQDELCVRFGFCGDEYDAILRELNQNGRATLEFR
jgi:hypothetical protein